MCGITGRINFSNRPILKKELVQMTDAIHYRGPDDEGFFIEGNVGLGFRRLSIIDLKLGHQPLCDSSKRYWITFNGEIYNYKEQKDVLEKKGYRFNTNSDTEVIVNLYAEYGQNCLEHLRGMFAFVIWDSEKKELFGARDRFGIKPFYYYEDQEKFIWASELKSIIKAKEVKKEIDLQVLDYYFTYGYTPKDRSIYSKIKKLQPGHFFLLKTSNRGEFKCTPYWKIHLKPDYSKSESYWKEALYSTLEESVKMRLMSEVPLGAFLSGGVDSSIVVALMSLNSEQPIKTFSVGFMEEKFNELEYARIMAKHYGTEHHEFILEPDSIDLLPKLVKSYDEPFGDASAIPTYYISKMTKGFVTVALSGDGGDELFAGYRGYKRMLSFNNHKFEFKRVFSVLNRVWPDHLLGKGLTSYLSKNKEDLWAYFSIFRDYEREHFYSNDFKSSLNGVRSENEKIQMLRAMDGDFLSNMQQLDMQSYLVDDILTKVDRASMQNSLEVRVPILDHKFAELSFKIPSQMKLNDNYSKHIFKEAFKHILPKEIIQHKKQGFALPLKIWFKGDLKVYTYDSLLQSKKLFQYMDKGEVEKLLRKSENSKRDYGSKIWSLLFLNEWLQQND